MLPTLKAALDLLALLLIYAGTLVITLGGVPALIGSTLVDAKGNYLVDGGGNYLVTDPDPDVVEARRRYMQWVMPGLILITLGALWQGVDPVRVILSGIMSGKP